jgi:hypothetical protein
MQILKNFTKSMHTCCVPYIVELFGNATVAMDTCASPIQQMSFETTMNFIVNASIHGSKDTLKSPSAQIVTGKLVSCGTGSFELLKALTV